jgi:uncharacterized membrane protein
MQDLGTLGGTSSGADSINESGQIVGFSLTSLATEVPFLWDATHGMRTITSLTQGSEAFGINSSAQIVGLLSKGTGLGFRWTKAEGMQNLNGLVPKGFPVNSANAINRYGQIAVNGTFGRALLLTPTKQPSSQGSKP